MENGRPKSVINPGVKVVNDSSLAVSWEPGDETATKYDVIACGHDVPTKSVMADSADFFECELENIVPNTEYEIKIVAVRDKAESDPVFVHAKTKICPFKYFESLTSTETTITIKCPEPSGCKDVYYISLHEYTAQESIGNLIREETIPANGTLVYPFAELVPGRRYHVAVKCGGGGLWSEEKTVDISTKVARPTNFKVLSERETSANVQWDHPVGDRIGYILRIVPKGEATEIQTISVSKHETSYTIEHLQSGTEYVVYLHTASKRNKSIPVKVTFTTFPARVERVNLSSDEPGTLVVDWDEAPGQKHHYALALSIFNSTLTGGERILCKRIQPRIGQLSVGPRWIQKDLLPLETYKVSVTTWSGNKPSEECTNYQTVKPHPPQITVNDEDITSNSIHLSWSTRDGNLARVKNYIVSISPKHATPSAVVKTPEEIESCPEHTFTNLQSGTEYTLTVCVQYTGEALVESRAVMKSESEFKSWTLPEKPGPLQIEALSPTAVRVSWTPSSGRVDNYLIEMTSGEIQKRRATKGATCTFQDVDPFVAYVISVRAVTGPRKSEAVFGEKRPMYENQQGPLIFISHAGEDKEAFVEPLLAALFEEGLSETDIFYDKLSISTGDTIRQEIISAISNKTLKLFVIVVSKNFFGKNKYWPRLEYELSLKENIPLYPIWLDENDDSFKSFSYFVGEGSSLLKGKRAACVGYTENVEAVKGIAREIKSKVSHWLKPRETTTARPEPSDVTSASKEPGGRLPSACAVSLTMPPHPTEGENGRDSLGDRTSTLDDAPEQRDNKHLFEEDGCEDVTQGDRHGEETAVQGDDNVNKLAKQIQDLEQSGWEVVTLMMNKNTGGERTISTSTCMSFLERNPDIAARFKQFVLTSNGTDSAYSDSSYTE